MEGPGCAGAGTFRGWKSAVSIDLWMEGRLPCGGVKRRSGEGWRGLRSPARKPNSMAPEGLPLPWNGSVRGRYFPTVYETESVQGF
jgi:hypothetical protein